MFKFFKIVTILIRNWFHKDNPHRFDGASLTLLFFFFFLLFLLFFFFFFST